ncbi:ABC transporter ATP-binding protein [Pseudomonas sp. SL4(2022)]|uniref:ATP-binding cassette domain-containing protein n=1 Tax=Pseudomonas sp. SL4(2022) TaxID=2994661 RepID=UPI00226F5AFB|nr:ABC transporter ATP-binding protein [Pseudomonas sp. SL4(2022)]WAC46090.1 ABC transporter ATP-binding protein [Pseudomonas sp. SL4(2022)]
MALLLLGKAALDALSALLVAALLGVLLPMGRNPAGWYALAEEQWNALAGTWVSPVMLLLAILILCKGVLAPVLSGIRGQLIDAWTLLISMKVFERELTREAPQRIELHTQGSNVAVNYLVPKIVMGTVLPSLELLTELMVISVLLGVLLIFEPLATVIMIAALLAAVAAGSVLSKYLTPYRLGRSSKPQILMQRWVSDSVACLREIRLYRRLPAVLGGYLPVAKRFARETARERTLMDIQSPVIELLLLSILGGAVLIASETTWQADLHPLVLFAAVGLRLIPGLRRISFSLLTIKFSRPFFEQIAAANPSPPEVHTHVEPCQSLPQLLMSCEALNFQYPQAEQKVIANLKMHMHKSDWVGLVGQSGAGKSTLVDLLIGELKPTAGCIQWFHTQREHGSIGYIGYIGYIGAFTTLLPGTLRENLAFLGTGCTDEHLMNALNITGLEALVKRFPNGLDTPVEVFEQRISSGERQRIGLARALLHSHDLLILDEATASLDQLTEHQFLQALRSARPELAVLLITHRLAALRYMDRTLQLADGALHEFVPEPQPPSGLHERA